MRTTTRAKDGLRAPLAGLGALLALAVAAGPATAQTPAVSSVTAALPAAAPVQTPPSMVLRAADATTQALSARVRSSSPTVSSTASTAAPALPEPVATPARGAVDAVSDTVRDRASALPSVVERARRDVESVAARSSAPVLPRTAIVPSPPTNGAIAAASPAPLSRPSASSGATRPSAGLAPSSRPATVSGPAPRPSSSSAPHRARSATPPMGASPAAFDALTGPAPLERLAPGAAAGTGAAVLGTEPPRPDAVPAAPAPRPPVSPLGVASATLGAAASAGAGSALALGLVVLFAVAVPAAVRPLRARPPSWRSVVLTLSLERPD